MIIDCHGHYTTAPKALENWRNQQIAGIKDPAAMPKVADLKISDDELRESIEQNQLRLMKERGSDLTIFSPRASFMAHHIGDFQVSSTWAAICNELCYRVSQLFPDHFIPAAMLPQSPGVDPKTCIPELVKCVEQYGNVGINLNPDPSGGQGPAFRALLDRLEAQAQGLADTSETIQDSAGLVDAVGQSERALEQARQLTDQLLEAFRANQTRLSA